MFLKLKRLSKGLQKWSHTRIGNIKLQLQIAKEIFYWLEVDRDSRPLTNGEDWLRKKLKLHCLGLASLERTITRLRSRITYPREGGANTSFFFTSTLGIEKKNNFTGKLLVGDQVISDQAEKQELVSESMKISLAHLMTERSRLIYLASIIRIMIHPI